MEEPSYKTPNSRSTDFEAWADCLELFALLGKPSGVSTQDMPQSVRQQLNPNKPTRAKLKARQSAAQTSVKKTGEEDLDALWSIEQNNVLEVIRIRGHACAGYPFVCENYEGFRISRRTRPDVSRPEQSAYYFMLLATRMDMGKNRSAQRQDATWIITPKPEDKSTIIPNEWLDGAELFEHLCCLAIKGYLGARCETHHFGAGPDGSKKKLVQKFMEVKDKVNDGIEVKAENDIEQIHGDGGLDLIAWVSFAENLPSKGGQKRNGKLLLFGQCKTGTSYDVDAARRLDPTGIVEDFLKQAFAISSTNILRVFMVADRPEHKKSLKFNRAGGLLFDRCRITDCLETAPHDAELIQALIGWSEAAMSCSWFDACRPGLI
jgi:hypothetical protein